MKLFLIFSLLIIIVNTNNDKIVYKDIFNNLRRNKVKRELQEESNIYNLNVTNYNFFESQMELLIHSEPELDNDITLLIKLYIDKYNYTLGYWTNKEIDVRAYDYSGTGEVFTANVEELILDRLTGDMSITILNISVESYNASNVYYIFFEERTFNFPGINVPEIL